MRSAALAVCLVGGVAWGQGEGDFRSACFVSGDFLVYWQSGGGTLVTYRGIPLFAPNASELVVHRAWQDVYYRTSLGHSRGTLEEGEREAVLTIRDRDEYFAFEKRIVARRDGTLRIEYGYKIIEPPAGEIQVLWGIGKPWIHQSRYRLLVGDQEREGELSCPDAGRTDPWGGATEQTFVTEYGTLTIKAERPLNLLCQPDGGALWYSQALTQGERYTQAIDVSIEPGPQAETGVRLAGLDWTKAVRDGRARFTVALTRVGGGPERVRVRAEQSGLPGEGVEVALGEAPVQAQCEVGIEGRGSRTLAVVVEDAANGEELLRLAPLMVESLPYLRVMPRLSLYTHEATAEIVVDLAEDLEPEGLVIELQGQRQPATEHRMLVPLDIAERPDGVSEVRCRLLRGEEELAQATAELRKAPPKANEVKIDNVSRSLIADEVPCVPFGFYTYYPLKEGVIDEEVVRGFTLFSPYHGGPHEGDTLAPILAYMDRCAAVGMKVNYHLMWSNRTDMDEAKWAQLRAEIEAVRDHPALLSWYTADEPAADRVAHLEQVYSLLKELDPHHPVAIVFCRGAEHASLFRNALDIVMADPYPIPNGPPTAVSSTADAMNEAYDFRNLLWIVPQAFGGNEGWRREPTAQEQRVMTYLALIHDARAIQYFIRSPRVSFPKSPVMWSECGTLALETAELTPALCSPEVAPKVTASVETVHACALQDRGIVTVLAVNTENRPQVVRLQLEGVDFSGEANVLFEDRKVGIEAGAIEEPIDAYGTRAYAVPVGPLPEDDLAIDAGNLVYNPSWEYMPSVGTPAGCYASVPPGATLRVDSRVARHGRHSLRMTAPSAGEAPSITPFPIRVTGGQTYRVSIWAKAQREGVALDMAFAGSKEQYPLTTEWREYTFNVTPAQDAGRAGCSLGITGAGVAWLDLFQVVPVEG